MHPCSTTKHMQLIRDRYVCTLRKPGAFWSVDLDILYYNFNES